MNITYKIPFYTNTEDNVHCMQASMKMVYEYFKPEDIKSFEEEGLETEGSFKDAEARYTSADQINTRDLARWLKKSRDIQWDYKNIVKRKGKLERIK